MKLAITKLFLLNLSIVLANPFYRQDETCNVKGQCPGTPDGFAVDQTEIDGCVKFCKEIPDVTWATFDSGPNLCTCYKTCDEIDDSCSTCESSEIACQTLECNKIGLCMVIILLIKFLYYEPFRNFRGIC